MMTIIVFLLLLLLKAYVKSYVEIVHCDISNSTNDCKEYEYYLLHNDVSNDSIIYYQGIPDVETVTFMGYDLKWVRQVSSSSFAPFTSFHKVDLPVPSLKLLVVSPDEVMRLYRVRFSILQNNDNLIKNLQYFGTWWNPTLIPFQNKYLVAGRTNVQHARLVLSLS